MSAATSIGRGAGQHDAISHHGYKAEQETQHAKINAYHVLLFSRFLEKLRATPDDNGIALGRAAADERGETRRAISRFARATTREAT